MAEPITTAVGTEILKAAVGTLAQSTFNKLYEKFSRPDTRTQISDSTRAALETYYERMAERLRPVRLFHFNDTRWVDQIYVSLKIHRELESPFRGWNSDQLEEYIRQLDRREFQTREALLTKTSERYDDTAILQVGKRLIILGKPGSGKTTFLKHLSLSYIRGSVPELEAEFGLLPIFVYLRELARRPEDMLAVLTEQIKDLALKPDTRTFLEECLEQGLCLLMFDGLDEVTNREAYDKVVSDVKRLCNQYRDNWVVITSRPTGYFNQLREDEFQAVEIEDMTPEQTKLFANGWFAPDQHRSAKKAEELRQGFRKFLDDDASIRTLATSPLMLSLLALSYEFELDLPKQRTELFSNCADALLVNWDASREFRRETRYEQLRQLKNSSVEHGYLFGWSLNQRRILPFKRTSPLGCTGASGLS